MKKILISAILTPLLAVGVTAAFAQTSVDAKDLLRKIKAGEAIKVENATITGDFDLTYYFEKRYDDEYSSKKRWWNSTDNVVEEIIETPIEFVNCKFEDDVIAYYHDDKTEYTFIASFENDAIFKNCKFLEGSQFKYSKFENGGDFAGSSFEEPANFKYAEFERFADFGASIFEDDANFKYAKFRKGLDFSDTRFNRDLNLKYANIDGDFSSKDMKVKFDLDVKYTEVNGKSFSKYLLTDE